MIYVCSDLHGQYEMYKRMLDTIRFCPEDELYILGDVIDRGPEPIDLLLDILMNPSVHLLAGNHEDMMLQAYRTGDYSLWKRNGAATTIRQFSRLSDRSKDILLSRLSSLPILIPDLTVNGRTFYLTHAGLVQRILNGPLRYSDAESFERTEILWSRALADGKPIKSLVPDEIYDHYRGRIVIFGHTPTPFCKFGTSTGAKKPHIAYGSSGHRIAIDCGAATGLQLGCLRLEDRREFYLK